MTAVTETAAAEDRVLPAVVYGLYLLGLVTFAPILVGFLVAWANRGGAGPKMRTHYVFQVGTVWTALGWWVIGGLLILVGIPLSFVLIGIPLLAIGILIFAIGHIWFAARCVLGLIYLLQDRPHPRPHTWLI